MKKLTLAIAVVVMGLAMTSCGGESPKEKITKSVDEFFTQAEQNVQKIASGEEFMNYFTDFEAKKSEFIQNLFGPYADADGNIKGFTEDEVNELQSYIYDRASAYNKVEAAKCAEFVAPLIEEYENAINAVCEGFGNVDEETFDQLTTNLENAENGLALFADYDNVPTELQQRFTAAQGKLDDFLKMLE